MEGKLKFLFIDFNLLIVSQRLTKGIPDCLRHKVWLFLANVEKYKFSENINYHELHGKRSDYENIINLDLDRTFPNNIYFQNDNKLW